MADPTATLDSYRTPGPRLSPAHISKIEAYAKEISSDIEPNIPVLRSREPKERISSILNATEFPRAMYAKRLEEASCNEMLNRMNVDFNQGHTESKARIEQIIASTAIRSDSFDNTEILRSMFDKLDPGLNANANANASVSANPGPANGVAGPGSPTTEADAAKGCFAGSVCEIL
jgi:hypothetical protein